MRLNSKIYIGDTVMINGSEVIVGARVYLETLGRGESMVTFQIVTNDLTLDLDNLSERAEIVINRDEAHDGEGASGLMLQGRGRVMAMRDDSSIEGETPWVSVGITKDEYDKIDPSKPVYLFQEA